MVERGRRELARTASRIPGLMRLMQMVINLGCIFRRQAFTLSSVHGASPKTSG
jgi:hypothetical protein